MFLVTQFFYVTAVSFLSCRQARKKLWHLLGQEESDALQFRAKAQALDNLQQYSATFATFHQKKHTIIHTQSKPLFTSIVSQFCHG
jgi:hypothetical protein